MRQQQPTNDNRGVGGQRGGAGQHGGGGGHGGHNNIGGGIGGGGGGYPPPLNQQFHHNHQHPRNGMNNMNNGMNYPQHHNHSNNNRPPPFPHSQNNPPNNNYDYNGPPPPHYEHGYPHDYPSQYQQPPHHPHHNHAGGNMNVPFPQQPLNNNYDNNIHNKPNQPPTYFQQCIPRTRTISHYKRISQIGEGTYGQVYSAQSIDQYQNPNSPKTIVALKKIRLAPKEENGLPRNVIREIKILKGLHHENMVKMIEVVSSKGYEYLDEEDERKDEKRKRLKLQQQQNQNQSENNMEKDSYKTSTNNNNDNDESNTNNQINNYKGNLFLVLEYISHDLSGILDMGHRFTPVQSKYIFHQLLSVLQYMHSQNYVHRDLKSSNILLQSNFKVKLADFGLARCMDDHEL